MKYFIGLILATSLFQFSCNPPAEKINTPETDSTVIQNNAPGFIHSVYFWLKEDDPDLLKEFKEKALPKLAEVPSIKNVYWGPPAGTPRDVVDNSYDISWIVTFDNAEEQDKYQVDPIHIAFVEKYKSLFERVQVYDSVVENGK